MAAAAGCGDKVRGEWNTANGAGCGAPNTPAIVTVANSDCSVLT